MGKFNFSGPLLRDPLAFAAIHKSLMDYGHDNPESELVVVVMNKGHGLELEANVKDDHSDDLYEYILEDMVDAGILSSQPLEIPPDFMVPVWTADFFRSKA